jgi:hypothetical protein
MRNYEPISGKCKNLLQLFVGLRNVLSGEIARIQEGFPVWNYRHEERLHTIKGEDEVHRTRRKEEELMRIPLFRLP